MLNKSKVFVVFVAVFCFLLSMCNQKKANNQDEQTILKGKLSVLTDETLTPVVDDQIVIFEDRYDAHFEVKPKSESEIVNDLLSQKYQVAFMARDLSDDEKNVFEQKKIHPRSTPFAIDAIALIRNKTSNDTLVALEDIVDFLNNSTTTIKGLVFDNPNSSTVRLLKEIAKVKDMPKDGVYSFKTNPEVVKFVAENEGMIGVVGVNWVSQPLPELIDYLDKIDVLSVKSIGGNHYYSPTQNDLAEGVYPLSRKLFLINCQGTTGLGMGLSSFVAGDVGQRIVLKSGLLPYNTPSRKVIIRNKIINDKK